MLTGTAFSELLPVVLGVGGRAKADWGFVYVTLHFVLLPALAVMLILAGGWSAISAMHRNHKPLLAPTLSAFIVSLLYVTALALDPELWSRGLIK